MFGGRAGGKSWAIAMALLVQGMQQKLRILCTRELQNSISDSVHKLLSDVNDKYNLGYEITNNEIRHPITGTSFMFYGLKSNITKIKSLEAVDICWIEEAETISERSLEVLIPTIRKDGSEIWMSFNPFDENDAVYKTYIIPHLDILVDKNKYVDAEHYILKVNYNDNPFLPETIKKEIQQCKVTNYRKYQHIYEGLPVGNDENCLIDPAWFDAAIDAHKKLNFKQRGAKVIGFDPADEGKDNKAAVYRYGTIVEKIWDWDEGTLEDSVEKVYSYAQDTNTQEIVYDGTGIGAGAKIKFNQYDPNDLIIKTSFIAASKPDFENDKYKDNIANKDMFRNKRAQYYWLLRDRFENTYRAIEYGEYSDPDEMISISSDCENIDELKSELTKVERKRRGANQLILIESKVDMRKRGLKSPNIADALVYCFANMGPVTASAEHIELNFASEW
jgi:phage terminase large subunit